MREKDLYDYLYFVDDKKFLDDFLNKKHAFQENKTDENYLEMLLAFDIVYTNFKHAMHARHISNETFKELTKTLKADL